jgi:hypothetical protein
MSCAYVGSKLAHIPQSMLLSYVLVVVVEYLRNGAGANAHGKLRLTKY